jgi:hypothetical protein
MGAILFKAKRSAKRTFIFLLFFFLTQNKYHINPGHEGDISISVSIFHENSLFSAETIRFCSTFFF